MNPTSKRYIVAIVDLDRVVTKYSFTVPQADTFLWLAQSSFADAEKFASLQAERSPELLVGQAFRFRLFDKLAAKRFKVAMQRQRRG